MKKFSVIIPATDPTRMDAILAALRAQSVSFDQGEALVVGSDRSGLAAESDLARFIPTAPPNTFASDKRNIGMRAARGEVLLFMDDDCFPRPDWIERHLARQARGEQVVGGAVAFPKDNILQLADNLSAFHFMTPSTASGCRYYLCGANLSVHRRIVEQNGEMKPHQNRAEDLEWTLRMRAQGIPLYFDPHNIVLHDPERRTLGAVWRHWILDAPPTVRVRLQYAGLLHTPRLARYRLAYLLGGPLIAAWATARALTPPGHLKSYWRTLPLVYLTKLAWCWSAYKNFPRLR